MILIRVVCSDPSESRKSWHQDFEDLYQAQLYANAMHLHFEFVQISIIHFKEIKRYDFEPLRN